MILLLISAVLLLFLCATWYLLHRFPNYPVSLCHKYDVCIVLGSPAKADGSLTRMQKSRMDRAIGLYDEKICSYILISGGCVLNAYSEAETMAHYAKGKGVSASAILLEMQARNTYENLAYAKKLCDANSFRTVVVVTSNFHVRRAAFFTHKFFKDFAMAGTLEKEKARHYLSEYFRMWNTLYHEIKLHKKK